MYLVRAKRINIIISFCLSTNFNPPLMLLYCLWLWLIVLNLYLSYFSHKGLSHLHSHPPKSSRKHTISQQTLGTEILIKPWFTLILCQAFDWVYKICIIDHQPQKSWWWFHARYIAHTHIYSMVCCRSKITWKTQNAWKLSWK